MINIKLRILRGLLEESIKNIDADNSNHSADELDEIIKDLTKLNRGIKRISNTISLIAVAYLKDNVAAIFFMQFVYCLLVIQINILYLHILFILIK